MQLSSVGRNAQAGKTLIVVLVVLVGIVVGVLVFSGLNLGGSDTPDAAEEDFDEDAVLEMIRERQEERDRGSRIVDQGSGEAQEGESASDAGAEEGLSPSGGTVPPEPPSPEAEGVIYTGTRIAGNADVPLLAFNQEDYDKAVATGEIILMSFYADWCPYCKAEEPEIEAAFDALAAAGADGIVGFRVNYNDSQTDANEDALAAKYNITYQHSKVITANGQVVSSANFETWSKARYLTEINAALGN